MSADPRVTVVADVLTGVRFPASMFHDETVRIVTTIEAEMVITALDAWCDSDAIDQEREAYRGGREDGYVEGVKDGWQEALWDREW